VEGEKWRDMEGVITGASLRDVNIDRDEAGSLMSIAIGLQDVRPGSRGSYPRLDGVYLFTTSTPALEPPSQASFYKGKVARA
jgi:hypothetical protein